MTSVLADRTTPALSPQVDVGPPVVKRGAPVHVVRDTRTDGHFMIGDREAFIIRRLDGAETFGRVAEEYRARFGRELAAESLNQLLGLLYAKRLLDIPGEPAAERDAAHARLREQNRRVTGGTPSLLVRRFPLIDPERAIDAILTRARWLVSAPFAAVATALVVAMIVVIGAQLATLWPAYVDGWSTRPFANAAALTALVVSLVTHEFTHGLTCVAFGGRCREMGVAWRLPLITVYTKVDDIFLLPSRRHRVTIAVAGTLAGLVVLLPAFAVLVLAPQGSARSAAVAVLLLGIPASLVNLLPVLRLDGQKALSHALGVWDVADEARHYWTGVGRLLLGRRSPARPRPRLTGAAAVVVPCYGVFLVVTLLGVTVAGTLWWWNTVGQTLSPAARIASVSAGIVSWLAWGLVRRARHARGGSDV